MSKQKKMVAMAARVLQFGVLVEPDVAFSRAIIMGAIRASRQCGVFLGRTTLERFLAEPERFRFDGVLTMCYTEAACEALRAWGKPVINASASTLALPLPRIVNDDEEVGRLAAEHLLSRHYRHIGYMGFVGRGFSDRRQEGFVERLAADGVACHLNPELTPRSMQGFLDWVRGLPRPLAIFCANDTRARQVASAAEAGGLKVPEELAILGVDNDPLECEAAGFPISSVEVAGEKIGELGIQHLAACVREDDPLPREVLVKPLRVIARLSTDFTATRDPDVGRALAEIQRAVRAGERPNTARIADAAILTRRTLERKFRKELGRTIHQEVERMAVDRAKGLLLETDLSIKQVAMRCGYRESRRFGEAFRRVEGITAGAYRARYKGARKLS